MPTRSEPTTILAGIGGLEREALCRLIAVIETANTLEVVQGAAEDVARMIHRDLQAAKDRLEKRADDLIKSALAEDVLRHRLWYRLNQALVAREQEPSSTASANRSAHLLAVKCSEQLSSSIHARRSAAPGNEIAIARPSLKDRAKTRWAQTRRALTPKPALPFSDVVEQETLDLLASEALGGNLDAELAPELKAQLDLAHGAAQRAAIIGGGWASFSAVVSGAGFAPYILAAQASAWIPMVSGPTLVSILATLINPITLAAGLSYLAWQGTGQAADLARRQVAARLVVLLAAAGHEHHDQRLGQFLASMRGLSETPISHFRHLNEARARNELLERQSWMAARWSHTSDNHDPTPPTALAQRLKTSPDWKVDSLEAAAIGTITAADIVWHAALIDPRVLSAADFSRNADLGDPMSFALAAWQFAVPGADYSLRGYTGEQVALHQLLASGHDVHLATASNMPGYDLMVDGLPVQVKCGESLDLLKNHFEKYPDIPVVANPELVELARQSNAEWASQVTTLPGMDLPAIERLISSSLDHAHGITEPDLLPIAFALGLARGGYEVWTGRLDAADLPAWLLVDAAARGSLGLVGTHIGSWAGLVAIGPAGALVLGPVLGVAALAGTGRVRQTAVDAIQSQWMAGIREKSNQLKSTLENALTSRLELLKRRFALLLSQEHAPDDAVARWVITRSDDQIRGVAEALYRIQHMRLKTSDEIITLCVEATRLAPTHAPVLRERHELEEQLANRPNLVRSITDAGNTAVAAIRRDRR